MKIPLSLKIYAGLAFVGAAVGLVRLVYILFGGSIAGTIGSIAFELLWAAFNIALGVGILRLRPGWRIVALICCWWVFALFALLLVAWCIWPQAIHLSVVVIMVAAVGINGWFYHIFRRPDVRQLFHAHAAATQSV